MLEKYPNMREEGYFHRGSENDRLFDARYPHQSGIICGNCSSSFVVPRTQRRHTKPKIHYGTIGSGSLVIRNAALRDLLGERFGILCVEMEAAGLMGLISVRSRARNQRLRRLSQEQAMAAVGCCRCSCICQGTPLHNSTRRDP